MLRYICELRQSLIYDSPLIIGLVVTDEWETTAIPA